MKRNSSMSNLLHSRLALKLDSLKEPAKPWEKIKWPEEQIKSMYCDWGSYFLKNESLTNAAKYYMKSIEYDIDDRTLYHMSHCKRVFGDAASALEDALIAVDINRSAPHEFEVIKCLHESNQTVDAIAYLFDCQDSYHKRKIRSFQTYLDILYTSINDTIGPTLTPFICKNQYICAKAYGDYQNKKLKQQDERPLWRKLKDENCCDVTSIIEEEPAILSPSELARRKRDFKILNQMYFGKSWMDIVFLKSLIDDPNLMLKQTPISATKLQQFLCQRYNTLTKYQKMLRGQCPTYYYKAKKCLYKKICAKRTEEYLYRVQYQTRRTAMIILRQLREYRNNGEVKKMVSYIEEVMGEYITLKTNRIMPWKFEFINEVYNLLSLTLLDFIKIPDNFTHVRHRYQLLVLFDLLVDKELKVFEFGKRSTHTDIDDVERRIEKHKNFLAHCERRLLFAEHYIELAYLYYEMAKANLNHHYYTEAIFCAKMGDIAGKKCNNAPWRVLNLLLIAKVHVKLFKIEQVRSWLEKINKVAAPLNNEKLNAYIELCQVINYDDIQIQSRNHSFDSIGIRKRKSKMSVSSVSLHRSRSTFQQLQSERSLVLPEQFLGKMRNSEVLLKRENADMIEKYIKNPKLQTVTD